MRLSFPTIIKLLTVALLLSVSIGVMGANTKQTVEQVNSNVVITADWDYIVTSSTPFGSSGVVNLVNTEHAVLILSAVKPSAGINLLSAHVRINGQKAVDGTNCQVKMYNKGCIILPYASNIQPLTCYTGIDFSGTSYSGYTTGSNDGFMKTLTDTELKNNFKSFKLKRGYMVTFATGTAGWGYSRCFIADAEDLAMNLPTVLSGKVSSYRLFKWQNFGKTGIANNTDAKVCDVLNVQGCYTYNVGENMLPDVEWLPHRIQKWWPGVAVCGSTEYACTMKTDNEPANPSDDNPASVDDVLGYWEDVMRTGMRLCSPSTYDGVNNKEWFDRFFHAIDSLGWRCDVYDIHCYWTSFDALSTHHSYYGRPLLISEWMWGASWSGGSGAFVNGVTDQKIAEETGKILSKLNNTGYVERYFYWNSESKAKIYDGGITNLGRVYAASDGGLGYNKSYEFVPKVVMKQPYSLVGTISGNNISFTWKDPNGDMMDEIRVQYKLPNASTWNTLTTVDRKDKTGRSDQSYSYIGTFDNAENYEWRIQNTYESSTYESNTLRIATSSMDEVSFLPSNVNDFYFQFYSKETNSDLVWAVAPSGENRVQYKARNSDYRSDLYQLWALEANSHGGYSLRNVGEAGYLIASPNSWNFVTRNNDYTEEAPQAAYGFDFNSSGNYWVCKNLYHNMYVGLWDNDKNFAAGEVLAGNRDSESTADHLGIRMILRSELGGGDVSPVEEATVGQSYYIYNVDAGKFLTGGNSYGTHASLGTNGLKWTLEQHTSGLYSLLSEKGYLYTTNEDGLWVDAKSDIGLQGGSINHDTPKTRFFALSQCSDDTYTLQVDPQNTVLGTSALGGTRYVGFVGDIGDTPYVLTAPKNSYHSGVGTKWILMSQNAYSVHHITIIEAAPYRQLMWPLVIAARAAGVGPDEIAIYENPLSTAFQIESATESLKTKLLAVEASESNPVDYSFLITNGDCASRSFEGWTTENSWGCNSTFYHKGDALLTNRFYESWVSSDQTLADRTISQTLTDLPAGKYQLSLDIIATHQADASVEVSGVTLFFGDQEVSCHSADGVSEVFTTPEFTVTEGTPVALGLKLKSTTANWVAFDNFRLIYFGLPPVLHDLTGDRRVDGADVRALVAHLLGNTPEGFNLDAADVNEDGYVNIRDVTALIAYILNPKSLPASSEQTTGEAS